MAGPLSTASATFVDIPGATLSVVLTASAYIWADCAVTWQPTSSSPTSGWRLVIDAQLGDETVDPPHASTVSTVALNLRTSAPLAAGTYVIKAQYRKSSGGGRVQLDHLDLFAFGLLGAIGPQGPQGPQGAALIVVNSAAALAAYNATSLPDFSIASAGEITDSYRLLRSPAPAVLAAADGANVIVATAPAGAVWTRLGDRNIPAEYEAQWYVDVAAGNDGNSGTAIGAPLKTLTEMGRRVCEIHQDVTVTVAAGDLSAYPFELDIETNGFSIAIVGAVTSTADDALAGVLATTAGTAGTNAGAQRGTVTATAAAFTDKQRLRLTSGAQSGATAHVTRVTTPGVGGVANVERWGQLVTPRTTSTVASVEPAVGNTFVADTLGTTIGRFDARARGHGRILFQDLNVSPPSVGDVIRFGGDNSVGGGVMLYRCRFPAATVIIPSFGTIACSQFLSNLAVISGSLVMRKNVYCGPVEVRGTGAYLISNNAACFDGGNLLLDGGGIWDQGTGSQNDHQWVDGTTSFAVEVDAASAYLNHGSGVQCWGLDNAYSSATILVQGNARWTYSSKPSIPGSGTAGRDATVGGTAKLYAALPYQETTTTANNGGGIVSV